MAAGVAGAGPRVRELEALSATLNAAPTVQRVALMRPANRTGLPNQLKAGVEALSGVSLDNVRVHRNSPKPAQLNAHAYAQGTDIHLAPGQERHLPHEAWHVVQQAQGRVAPTRQLRAAVAINDDAGLEHEADVMGARALGAAPRHEVAAPLAPLASATLPLQRVVGDPPGDAFNGNEAWARWFQAMTAEEVRTEGTRLGLAPGAFARMNEILERKGERLIAVPADYRAVVEDGSQSPFHVGSTATPLDVSEKPVRSKKIERREVASPVRFQIMRRVGDTEEYAPEDRLKALGSLPKTEFDFCFANPDKFFRTASNELAITLERGRHLVFDTENAELLGEELAAIHAIRYEEPEPRSGAARAAADIEAGTERGVRDPEAPYAGPIAAIGSPVDYEDYRGRVEKSEFTSQMGAGTIRNRIVHYGPWAKGVRAPSQMGVMGGQNAKNYFLDTFMYEGRGSEVSRAEKQKDLDDIGGRFEWLHIIGSSLGGPNIIGNLVCGTYDANTEMIALEHRVALWGAVKYGGDFQPTADSPVTIEGEADLEGTGFVAISITLTVSHGAKQVLSRTYPALRETVITKSEYKKAELDIAGDIDKARPAKAVASVDTDIH
ncbi:DUF4157 domain-containing protein [Sphingomonas sp. AR_OL41]|uniref:eCIS core domain-containing protein n=1 Tax=Sphingomonas sp. AR_OL41 TaxID=3042729 RepID=UPI0024805F5B|nr:DUF4157 domain-containing protein [Sphingomonas sp. AR_OL41]MDH7974271.1 DUF4157 domain-containing protein [Sphingomonas sp. AR_OL41]